MTVGCRDSYSKDALHSHGMATIAPIVKKTTGAVPLTIVIVGSMDIVLAPKRRFKARELDAFGFFSVAFGFSNLVDHA